MAGAEAAAKQAEEKKIRNVIFFLDSATLSGVGWVIIQK